MFCIVAFIILAVMGIFSASYRDLAKEAFSCVGRRVTLRPCTTGFDERMKSRILGTVIMRSETAARLINRNFEVISWTMFLLMVASTLYAARGLYLFYVTGSCSGLNETSFCLLDPVGESNKISGLSDSCRVTPTTVSDLTLKGVDLSRFPTLNPGGKSRIVLIGCYGCSYTKKVYPVLKRLAERNGAALVFADYPVKVRTTLATRLGHCVYQRDPAKYWRLNELLFAARAEDLDSVVFLEQCAVSVGVDRNDIRRCLNDPATENAVSALMDEISKTNFFGTPTVFIGSQAFVGPKPDRVYAIALKGKLYWLK
jgi:predicted DsbA family dithiol-disulfide isomerase